MATISQQLDQYLKGFSDRLKHLRVLRGTAVVTAAVLLVSVTAAWMAIRAGFADDVVITGRLVLLIIIAFLVYRFFVLPLKRLGNELAGDIERRTPAFSGRIETYAGMADKANPLRELLAEDTLRFARQYPPERLVDKKEMLLPGIAAGTCIVLLLWVVVAGPGLLNYAVRHLWAGWAFSGLLPPQSIAVTPGNEAVRRGGSVRLLAQMLGFEPTTASVHVRLGDNDWQEVGMVQTERGFEFTFFSLREPVDYYVASSGIRSPEYEIQVVDLPNINSLKLTYNYPEWTHRPPDVVEPGGDIRTIAGTNIDLEITTDMPLPGGVLVLNGTSKEMQVQAQTGKTDFDITGDGQYYVAARVGSGLVRLTDDYFIKVMEDGKPELKFTRPGRDWTASRIEEVTLNIEASDDYALESMELRYSVNGGEWQSVPLPSEGRDVTADHVFLLEAMQSENDDITEGEQANLVSGDLITYYAQATDKDQIATTDMYFIQVQPFDRRYTQSQMAGGGAGGQGSEQQEISQRQKEIIVSTWNLLREKTENGGVVNHTTQDNAVLLSELQTTLSEQALTLAERTRARELSANEEIARFVENLEKAVEAMGPASERLAAIDLEQAIRPEQEALQYLLRAEAVFTDMQVSFQQQGGGGHGSSRAGQDLAEMFELEMDLKKNQYETGSPATPQAQSQQTDDTMRQLEELARRQEQLANNMRQQQNMTEAQRWQQEMLRREAEQLRERLERMEQQASNNSQQGQQSSSSDPSGSTETSSGQQGEAADSGTGQSETSRRLQSAIRAMDEMTEAMRNQADADELQRAADEARRQLEGARDQVAEDQQRSMQQSFESMSAQAEELYQNQLWQEQQLQEAVKRALADRAERRQATSGLSREQEAELAQEKRAMSEDLQGLTRDIHATAERFREQSPEAVRELEEARDVINKTQLEERLNVAAEYIAYGAAPFIAGSESAVTRALDEIRKNLRDAQAAAEGAELPGLNDDLDRTLAQTRDLRRELEQLTRQGDQAGMGEQSGDRQPGQDQQGQSPGQQSGQGQDQGGEGQSYAGGGPGDWNGYANRGRYDINPADWDRFGRNLNDTARAIRDVIPDLRNQDLTAEEIDAIRDLTSQLEQRFAFSDTNRNEGILQEEYISALTLLEQLELRLDAGARNKEPANVRSTATEPVSEEYKDAVAEYYRRLSREE